MLQAHSISIIISKNHQSCLEKNKWIQELISSYVNDDTGNTLAHNLTCSECKKSKLECELLPEYPETKKYICEEMKYLESIYPKDLIIHCNGLSA